MSRADEPPTTYLNRTLWAVGIATAIVLTVASGITSLAYATDLFFLIFTSILFAICLNRVSRWMASVTPLSRGWALSLTLTVLLAAFLGLGFFFGTQIRGEVVQASERFDEAATRVDDLLRDRPLLRSFAKKIPIVGQSLDDSQTNASDARSRENESDSRASKNDRTEDSRSEEGGEAASRTEEDSRAASDSGTKGGDSEEHASSAEWMPSVGRVTGAVTRTFSTAFGVGLNLLIVLAMSIFLATEPKLYRDGLIRLFPKQRRERMADVLDRLETTLWSWALGRMATMAITGSATGAILWMLGVPLPFMMGLITGLLAFIPNIGGLIAVTLASLLALPQGLSTVAWVIGLYCAMQLVESYVLTPLIQQRQVSLPPALLIGFQAFMGLLFGFLGLMVASPLLAVAMVVVNQLYVKDALGDDDAPEISG